MAGIDVGHHDVGPHLGPVGQPDPDHRTASVQDPGHLDAGPDVDADVDRRGGQRAGQAGHPAR